MFAHSEPLARLQAGASLSEQLASTLRAAIETGQLSVGQKLPTESALVSQFGVSRTVVREAFSRLKTLGLIETRQGSGAFVKAPPAAEAQSLNLNSDGSVEAVLHMVEVRRALEAESAALAAARASAATLATIQQALLALDRAVDAGGDGVREDVAFHAAIAQAAGNPFLVSTLSYLNQFLEHATRVTRANEARKAALAQDVRQEHWAIFAAIEAGDAKAARAAGTRHMLNAAKRIRKADPLFWADQGRALAARLQADLPTHASRIAPA